MQMLENNQRPDKPERCLPFVYEVMLHWSWRYIYVCACVHVCMSVSGLGSITFAVKGQLQLLHSIKYN